MNKTRFIVVKHDAKKARLHYDLRIKLINSDNWLSFAVRKGVPLTPGEKVLAIKTRLHSTEEALFVGKIESGYGAGTLEMWDEGPCIFNKYSPAHLILTFEGKKVKGLYHMINTGVTDKSKYKHQQYILFKGKTT
jgi:bifunctional non-homologous end joining protein LigD